MQLICGINPVLEALSAATRHFDRMVVVKGLRNRRVSEAISRASQMGIPLRFESRETLDRMAGGLPHQGIIAVVSAKPAMGLDELLTDARTPPLVVVLDGVEDPRNLGAILRTSEAAGADGVLLPERHSAGLSETVARASAGGLEHVRVARIGNVVQALETLKSKGFWIVGFDGNATERWDVVDYRRPIALVLGGEGRGIRRLVREHCDHLVSIPLFGHVASLNVSVAAGIALYEAIRQRGTIPSQVKPIPARPSAAGRAIVAPGPDDNEHDPGHVSRPEMADGPDEGSEDDPVTLVQIEDEEQWTGPQVVHVRAHSRDTRGDRRNGRRGRFDRQHRPKPQVPNAAPAPQSQAESPQAGSAPPAAREGRGRKRRRRRGRGRDGTPGAPGADANADAVPRSGGGPGSSEQAPPTGGAPPPPTSNGETPSGGHADGGRRRRRRRKRR